MTTTTTNTNIPSLHARPAVPAAAATLDCPACGLPARVSGPIWSGLEHLDGSRARLCRRALASGVWRGARHA